MDNTAARRLSLPDYVDDNRDISAFALTLLAILQDNDSKDCILWEEGKIRITDQQKLSEKIIPKYFRHSRLDSFQRQLTGFGFKKIKRSRDFCGYVHKKTTLDVRSILNIKRKNNITKAKKSARKKSLEDGECSTVSHANSELSNIHADIESPPIPETIHFVVPSCRKLSCAKCNFHASPPASKTKIRGFGSSSISTTLRSDSSTIPSLCSSTSSSGYPKMHVGIGNFARVDNHFYDIPFCDKHDCICCTVVKNSMKLPS